MSKKITDIIAGDPRKRKAEEENKGVFKRRTYMIRKKYINLIDRMAYWDRRDKQSILDEALENYFKDKKIKEYPDQ
jgi:hypothetical protein